MKLTQKEAVMIDLQERMIEANLELARSNEELSDTLREVLGTSDFTGWNIVESIEDLTKTIKNKNQ